MNILIVSHQGVASGIASAAQMIVGDISQIHTIELTEAGAVSYTHLKYQSKRML